MQKNKKFGFTLVEVVLACSIFAIVVVGIILAINRSYAFMNNIKLSVRAANLAREGVEMMYNIRDTNWRKHSGERDKYWLYLGEGNISETFGTNFIFGKGVYALGEKKDENNNIYTYPTKLTDNEVFYSNDGFWKDSYKNARDKAKLTFSGTYSYYELDENDGKEKLITGNKIDDVMVGGGLEFYRIVRVFGVYKKNADTSDVECNSSTQECLGDGTPAEMRFCVKVFYRGNGQHASELCGIMTNFME